MRFNVSRLGEQYQDVTAMWISTITDVREFDQVQHLKVGQSVSFKRPGSQWTLDITRTA